MSQSSTLETHLFQCLLLSIQQPRADWPHHDASSLGVLLHRTFASKLFHKDEINIDCYRREYVPPVDIHQPLDQAFDVSLCKKYKGQRQAEAAGEDDGPAMKLKNERPRQTDRSLRVAQVVAQNVIKIP